jgi:hypothetical protein
MVLLIIRTSSLLERFILWTTGIEVCPYRYTLYFLKDSFRSRTWVVHRKLAIQYVPL